MWKGPIRNGNPRMRIKPENEWSQIDQMKRSETRRIKMKRDGTERNEVQREKTRCNEK